MARELLNPSLERSEFTLDDVSFPVLRVPDFEVHQVDLSTDLTKRIRLSVPMVSSPMDTVTEHDMAILMALIGGIGVIHYNFLSIEDQMKEVEKVRRYKAGFVLNPVVLNPCATVGSVFEKAAENGFFSYPVTADGTLKAPLVGLVTRRNVRYEEDLSKKVGEVMTPQERLIVANRKDTLDPNDIKAANRIIRQHNLDTLPIVDDRFRLVALVAESDIERGEKNPDATQDDNKQLKVLVAVESRLTKTTKERIKVAEEMGASGIVVDARNIYRDHLEIARFTREEAKGLDIILGNVVAKEVIDIVMSEAGNLVDAFRVGMGGGEVCTTTESLGIGRPLGSALYEVSRALLPYKEKYGHIGLIADGGIKMYPRHFVGALMLGADALMLGSELAGLDESPRAAVYDTDKKYEVKIVRGMGSPNAMRERQGGNRYGIDQSNPVDRYPEGREKAVAYKGKGEQYISQFLPGVRQAFQGLGCRNYRELQEFGHIVPAIKAVSKGTL